MYKVFVNDKPLFLTNEIKKETDFKFYLLESADINQIIIRFFQNKIQKAYLYHPDEKEIIKTLKSKIPVSKAGGGLVYNKNGAVLFIFRNGKWDLPKGKLEMGESPEEAAIRECEEECGITQLTITKTLNPTYHIYKHKGGYALKKTYWYSMQTKHTGDLVPQIEERIERVEWFTNSQIKDQVLLNTYPAILEVIQDKF